MADETPKPAKPRKEEYAKVTGRGTVVGQTFVELLQPTDPILLTRGGRNYALYRETLRDDQCAATFSDRRLAVTSNEWQVDAASDDPLDVAAADFVRGELQRVGFDRATDGMLYARWYGHAVAECIWSEDGSQIRLDAIKVRDRGRFAYGNDGSVWLLTDRGQWERMPDRKFWTVCVGADNDDEPFGLGLAHYCYWPVFFKRNDLKFWLVFAEKFGAPTAVGKVPAGKWKDEELKDAVLEALLQFASEAAIVVPEEATVELLEAARSGAGTYDELYDRMDAALAKLIIGQTASSQGTPGRLGNEELQAQVRQDIVKADADMVCDSFNRQVATWLTEWNYPGARPPRVWRKVEPEEDLKAVAETDQAIKSLGFQLDEAYVKDRYGAHWSKAEPLNLGAGLGLGLEPTPMDTAAAFAEVGAIGMLRAGNRADQQAMKDAAQAAAAKYQQLIGDRVGELVAYAEQTGDYATFQKHLVELFAELPSQQSVDSVRNMTFLARLLARWRGQR